MLEETLSTSVYLKGNDAALLECTSLSDRVDLRDSLETESHKNAR